MVRPFAHEREWSRWRKRPDPELLRPAALATMPAALRQHRPATVVVRFVRKRPAEVRRLGTVGELDPEPKNLGRDLAAAAPRIGVHVVVPQHLLIERVLAAPAPPREHRERE